MFCFAVAAAVGPLGCARSESAKRTTTVTTAVLETEGYATDDDDSPATLSSWRLLESRHFVLKTDLTDINAREFLMLAMLASLPRWRRRLNFLRTAILFVSGFKRKTSRVFAII